MRSKEKQESPETRESPEAESEQLCIEAQGDISQICKHLSESLMSAYIQHRNQHPGQDLPWKWWAESSLRGVLGLVIEGGLSQERVTEIVRDHLSQPHQSEANGSNQPPAADVPGEVGAEPAPPDSPQIEKRIQVRIGTGAMRPLEIIETEEGPMPFDLPVIGSRTRLQVTIRRGSVRSPEIPEK